jgi:hypothetical protein
MRQVDFARHVDESFLGLFVVRLHHISITGCEMNGRHSLWSVTEELYL